jgi:outer membrane biosynthesis protein TonB
MSAAARALGPDDRDPGDELFYPSLSRPGDGKVFAFAMGFALLFHIAILLVNLPRMVPRVAPPEQNEPPIALIPMTIPPPPIEAPPPRAPRSEERILPIPDPDPDDLEPLREEPILIEDLPPISDDFEPDFDAEPPPAAVRPVGPLTVGIDGVTPPRLIVESKVKPDYPEAARLSRLGGEVRLQAIVRADGSVGEIRVLS